MVILNHLPILMITIVILIVQKLVIPRLNVTFFDLHTPRTYIDSRHFIRYFFTKRILDKNNVDRNGFAFIYHYIIDGRDR